MIASHAHRFIFVKTRKTAGTSLEIALSRHCGPDDVITPISPSDEAIRLELGGRGPQHFDTEPRAYNHMSARRVVRALGRDTWDRYFTFAFERNPWDVVASSWRYSSRRPAFTQPFGEFVRSPRVHRLAENQRLYRLGDRVAVDRVYLYEELPAALADLSARLGLDLELPRTKGGGIGPHYRELYTEEEATIVARAFDRTIRDFGYTF